MSDNFVVFGDVIKSIKIKGNDGEDLVTDVDMSNVKTTVNVTLYRLGIPIRYYFDLDSGKFLFATGNDKEVCVLDEEEINLINIDNCIPLLNHYYDLPLHSFLVEVRSKLLMYDCTFENFTDEGATGDYTIPRDNHTDYLSLQLPKSVNSFNITAYIRMMMKKIERDPTHVEIDKLIGVEPYQ